MAKKHGHKTQLFARCVVKLVGSIIGFFDRLEGGAGGSLLSQAGKQVVSDCQMIIRYIRIYDIVVPVPGPGPKVHSQKMWGKSKRQEAKSSQGKGKGKVGERRAG